MIADVNNAEHFIFIYNFISSFDSTQITQHDTRNTKKISERETK